jgi:hypothetical protein
MRIEVTELSIVNKRSGLWPQRFVCLLLWSVTVTLAIGWPSVDAWYLLTAFLTSMVLTSWFFGAKERGDLVPSRTPGRPAQVAFDEAAITIILDGRIRRFGKGDIESSWREHSATSGDNVVIRTTDGDIIRLSSVDPGRADAVLAAVGITQNRHAVTWRLGVPGPRWERILRVSMSQILGFCWVLFEIQFSVLFDSWTEAIFVSAIALCATLLVAVQFLWPLVTSTIVIGTEAVLVRRFIRRWLVSRASYLGVSSNENRLVISWLRGGKVDGLQLVVSSPEEAAIIDGWIDAAMKQNAALLTYRTRSPRDLVDPEVRCGTGH